MQIVSDQRGNIFFYILLAVVLIAALSLAIASSMRGNSGISNERINLVASEVIESGSRLAETVARLRLRGIASTAISFENSTVTGYANAACTTDPWRARPPEHGKPDTVSRYFRRLTHAGTWEKLLTAIKESPPNSPLREIAPLICRACRRAIRLRGLKFIALARRLGFLSALNGPPGKLPNPDLSEKLKRLPLPPIPRSNKETKAFLALIKARRYLHRLAGGIKHIPRRLRLGWS